MRIASDESVLDGQRACLALGMFDGVHRGHQALMHACIAYANAQGAPSYVYTYSNAPHPEKVQHAGGVLTTAQQKMRLCRQMGFTGAILQRFTDAYASQSPQAFVQMLCQNARTRALFCGQNYRFGRFGRGDIAQLQQLCAPYGTEVHVVEDIAFAGALVSSTRVREALLAGDCALAQSLLGRPYEIEPSFQNGCAAWTDNARLRPGRYLCRIAQAERCVEVAQDGTIRIGDHKDAPVGACSIQFLQRQS